MCFFLVCLRCHGTRILLILFIPLWTKNDLGKTVPHAEVTSGPILGPSWGQLGAILGPFGAHLGHLGLSWGHLGAILGLSWPHVVAVLVSVERLEPYKPMFSQS